MDLTIASRASNPPERSGDFGARVDGNQLLVPPLVHKAIAKRRLATAEQFVAFVFSDPYSMAMELGWTEQDMLTARGRLVEVLRGYVSEDILTPQRPRRRRFGALPPKR